MGAELSGEESESGDWSGGGARDTDTAKQHRCGRWRAWSMSYPSGLRSQGIKDELAKGRWK